MSFCSLHLAALFEDRVAWGAESCRVSAVSVFVSVSVSVFVSCGAVC
jgi:hypothetical protein